MSDEEREEREKKKADSDKEIGDPYMNGERNKVKDIFLGFFLMIGEGLVSLFLLRLADFLVPLRIFSLLFIQRFLIFLLIVIGIVGIILIVRFFKKNRRYIAIGMILTLTGVIIIAWLMEILLSRLEDEKKEVFDFFEGFWITNSALMFIIIISTIAQINNSLLEIVFYSCLGVLGIIISIIGVRMRNKKPYTSMGMITPIFGFVCPFFKTTGEHLDDPYTEQPKKKREHFTNGFWLSTVIVILYTPLIWFGLFWFGLLLFTIIALNTFIGVSIFFYKEKFRYISIGVIFSSSMWILLFVISIPLIFWHIL